MEQVPHGSAAACSGARSIWHDRSDGGAIMCILSGAKIPVTNSEATASPSDARPGDRVLRLLTRLFRRFLVFLSGCTQRLADRLRCFRYCGPQVSMARWRCASHMALAAYVILPSVVRLSLKVLHRGLIP